MGRGDPVQRPPLLAPLLVAVALLPLAHTADQSVLAKADDYKPDCLKDDTYFRHPEKCDVFYHCANDIPFEKKCYPGLVFDLDSHNCVRPSDVFDTECGTGKRHPPLSKEEVEKRCSENPKAVFADPSGCQLYYNCSKTDKLPTDVLPKFKCECYYPYWFSDVSLRCDHYSRVNCGLRKKAVDKCDWLIIGKYGKNCSGENCTEMCKNKYPSCRGIPNGFNANPLKKWTADYMECKDYRLMRLRTCPFDSVTETKQVYDPERKGCMNLYEVPKEAGGHPFSCKRSKGCYPDDVKKNKRLYFCCMNEMLYKVGKCQKDEFFDGIKRSCLNGTDPVKEALGN